MGIFTKKKQKSFTTYSEDSEEDNHVDNWIEKSLTHNDDKISFVPSWSVVSGSSVKPTYPIGDPTTIPMNLIQQHQQPVYFDGSGTYNPYKYPVMLSEVGEIEPRMLLSDDLIDKMWEKMYSRPVIVRCGYCNSHNVISNPTCIKCGAPMGSYKEMKKYGR